MSKVEVFIINYNYAQYLPERIESVLHQTYDDFTVTMIDDCSTDNSVEVMQRYAADPRVKRIIVNEHNTGLPFAQWIKSIELAESEYIWIAEADDVAKPEFLERTVALAEREHLVFVKTASDLIDTQSRVIMKHGNNPEQKDFDHLRSRGLRVGQEVVYDGRAFIRKLMLWHNYVFNGSSVLFRRDAVTAHALRAFALRSTGDWLFWCRLAMQGRIGEVTDRLNGFRQHSDSATQMHCFRGFMESVETVKAIERDLNLPPMLRFRWRFKQYKHVIQNPYHLSREQCRQVKRSILSRGHMDI